jgi:hypothetical protein
VEGKEKRPLLARRIGVVGKSVKSSNDGKTYKP